MNWLFPGFLTGGLLVGLPLALHFLRSRPKQIVRFPTLRFLGESAIRDTRKHRLRRLLTLALRTLIILLLAAAFARPFWKKEQAARHSVMIIAIDNSMSMQATGRWEQSRRWALSQLDSLAQGDQAGLLLMNPVPVWLVPVTDDLAGIRAALLQAQPGFETTRYAGALRMAGDALSSNPARKKILVWMTDEQRLGWLGTAFDHPLPPGVKIRFGDTAPPPKRQATITSARWLSEPGVMAIEVSVRLFEPATEMRRITVRAAGDILAEQEITLQRGADAKIRLPLKLPAGKQIDGIRISLDDDDLPAGGTAWLTASPERAMSVLFAPATSDADFLAHALGSTHKLAEGALKGVPFPAGDWPPAPVAIARGAECFDTSRVSQFDRFMNAGGALWIFVDGSPQQTQWLKDHGVQVTVRPASETAWHLRDWDSEHPALAAFAKESLMPLMDIEFYRGFNLEGENLTPVANWPEGAAAMAEWNSGGHRMFLCGFPLERDATNWLVQPSFVPFIHQTVSWLALLANTRTDWRVGDTIPLPSPEGVWRTVDVPRSAPVRKVMGSVRPDEPGLYEFFDGKKRQYFSVNIPVEETDLSPWPDRNQFAALESTAPARPADVKHIDGIPLSDETAESQQRLWWSLLAVCGIGMLAELSLANRTAT